MIRSTAVICLVLAALPACTTTSIAGQSPAPTIDELKNATYTGVGGLMAAVTLHDGRWAGKPAVAGGASIPLVELAGDLRVTGDLDGDGQPEAVAVLTFSTGGSGVRSYLVVVTRDAGRLRNTATTLLGDRVQIRSVRINDRKIVVSAVRAGAGDAACCGGELVEWQWAPGKDQSNPLVSKITGRLSLDTLSGTVWVLQAWNIGEPAASTPAVTLKLESGRLTGASGCNRYSAGVQGGATPGEFSVGLIAGTRMACPERESAVEARFLEQLAGARKFGFLLGRLAITYMRADGELGTMLFDGHTVAPTSAK
jgi:heat shock protein HslJ